MKKKTVPSNTASSSDSAAKKASAAAPTLDADLRQRIVLGLIVLVAGIWAYFPTIAEMVTAWDREADYSHGYLVAPIAGMFLWLRRDQFPGLAKPAMLAGILLIAGSFALRLFASLFFFDSMDAWSILLWIAGVVAIVFGNATLRWAAPAIVFLFFMIPLPYRVEGMLSGPLQRVATKVSSFGLQTLGQPAVSEGNTILLGDYTLEVEQACSGLRLFFSVMALAYAYLVLVRRTWWEKAILVLSIIPIAVIANSARIIATGLLYQWASSDAAKKFSHDFAGWAMIPLAAALFWAVLWYLGKLFPEQEIREIRNVISVPQSRGKSPVQPA